MAKKSLNTVTGQKEETKKGLTLSELIAEENKKAIEAGTISTGEYLNLGIDPAKATGYTIESAYPVLSEDYFDKHEDYIADNILKSGNITMEQMDKERALNQSNWEQAANAFARLGTNIVPQIIGGFASMLDLPGYFDAEWAAQNSIVNWAADVKEWTNDAFPIYEENPEGFMQMDDFAWWMSRGEGLVESVGSFLAQGFGAAKIASLGLRGLAWATAAKKLAKTAQIGGNAQRMVGFGTKTLLSSTMLNQSENVLEATQVYNDIYEESLNSNYSEEEARTKAASAAATTMSINRINILLNLTSAAAFLQPLKLTRRLLKAPTIGRTVGRLGFEAGQEATEELVNLVASKAGMAKGRDEKYTFNDALNDMGSMEGLESAFLGAIGGIAQTGGQIALSHSKYGPGSIKDADGNRISAYQQKKERYELQQNYLQELEEKGLKVSDLLMNVKDKIVFQNKMEEAANILNDPEASPEAKKAATETIESLRTEMFDQQALEAFKLGTTQKLIDAYNILKEGDPDEMAKKYGKDYIKQIDNAIATIEKLEDIYLNYEEYHNVDEIFKEHTNLFRTERNLQYYEELYNDALNDSQGLYSNIAKKYSFKNADGTSRPLSFNAASIRDNTGDTKENQEIYDKFLKEVEKTTSLKVLEDYAEKINNTSDLIANLKENIKKITSPKHQVKAKKEKDKAQKLAQDLQKVGKTNSVSALEKLKARYSGNKDILAVINKKIEDLKIANAEKKAAKQKEGIYKDFANRITSTKDPNELLKLDDELKELDISQKDKTELRKLINAKSAELNGVGQTVSPTDPVSDADKKDNKNEEELADNTRPSDYETKSEEEERLKREGKQGLEDWAKSGKSIMDPEGKEYPYIKTEAGMGNDSAAHLSKGFKQTKEGLSITREDIGNIILENDLNKFLLNHDNITPSTKIIFTVDEDYDGEVYDPTSSTKQTISWQARLKELKEKYGDNYKESPAYISEVPIVAKDSSGRTLFYLHDANWMTEENLAGTEEEIIADKKELLNTRLHIVKEGELKSEITYKGDGHLLRTKDNENIPVSEAMEDPELVLGIGKNGVLTTNNKKIEGQSVNTTNPSDGAVYAVIPMSKGKTMRVPLSRQNLSEEVSDSIYNAIVGHLSGEETNPIVKAIYNETGLDITNTAGLREYISQFIYLFPTEGQEGLATILAGNTKEFTSNNGIITITGNGVEFGRPGIGQPGNRVKVLSQNFTENNASNLLALKKFLSKYVKTNADAKSLNANKPVVLVNNKGETNTVASYTEFVKTQFQTNVFSVNIGTESNPNWIYTIQPRIMFSTENVDKSKIIPVIKSDVEYEVSEEAIKKDKDKKTTAKKEKQRFDDWQVPIKKEEFIVTDKDGDSQIFTATTKLDGTITWTRKGIKEGDVHQPADIGMIGINSAREALNTFEESGQTVEVGKVEGYQTIMNPKKWNGLTQEQKERVDPERAAKEKPTQQTSEVEVLSKRELSDKELQDILTPDSYVRSIGQEGLEDALKSGVIRPSGTKTGKAKYKGTFYGVGQKGLARALDYAGKTKNGVLVVLKKSDFKEKFGDTPGTMDAKTREQVAITKAKVLMFDDTTQKVYLLELYQPTQQSSKKGPEIQNLEDIVNELTEDPLSKKAENLIEEGATLEQLKNILKNIEDSGEEVSEEDLNAVKQAIKAIESKQPTITVRDQEITGDIEDSSDNEDMFVPNLEELGISTIQDSEVIVLDGVSPQETEDLIQFISKNIFEALEKNRIEGKEGKIDTLKIFKELEEEFKRLRKETKEANMPNRTARIDNLLTQFDKIKILTNEYISLLKTGRVSEANADEVAGELEKTNFSDEATISLDSKSTASAQLRAFFGFTPIVDSKGVEILNAFLIPKTASFDVVYNTLHELLANQPADFDILIQTMEKAQDTFPWMKPIIEKLKNADKSIQNEFVSDMTKHAITMQLLLWKRTKNGGYRLMNIDANAASIQARLLGMWQSNFKGNTSQIYTEGLSSNLVTIDPDSGNYIFNEEIATDLKKMALKWEKMSETDRKNIPVEDLAVWLGNFGIVLSDNTYKALKDGKYYNNRKISYSNLFTNNNGLVKVLAKKLKSVGSNTDISTLNLFRDNVIKALAKLDSRYQENSYSNSFNAGGKTLYTYTNNKYLVNRMRDLLSVDNILANKLKEISFTKDSLWLNELLADDAFSESLRSRLGVNYLSLEALKELFTPSQDNRKLNNLTPAEQEVIKLGLFQSQSHEDIGNKRKVSYFYPTMSDKSTMMTIDGFAYKIGWKDGVIDEDSLELLYTAIILPEINRIATSKTNSGLSNYEPNYFYFLPSLNNLKIGGEFVRDLAIDNKIIGGDKNIKIQIVKHLKETFEGLVSEKLEDWNNLGLGKYDPKTKKFSFMDEKYIDKNTVGLGEDKRTYAAADFVFNSLIANAEMFKLFIGDPAQYAKNITINEDGIVNLEETFINIGKRLAGDIAPGLELANSSKNHYYQVFLKDFVTSSKNIEYLKKLSEEGLLTEEELGEYENIKTTDAQEYTTWQEHLYVLKQLGRLTTKEYKDLYTTLNKGLKLGKEDLGKIMQPMKPVYVGNQIDAENNLDRRIYIKSSSFPLLPQLTAGLEIDKLRVALENFQESVKDNKSLDNTSPFVRASFATANKVGGIKNGIEVFDKDGNVNDNIEITEKEALLLSRANFRIQQDVPYKESKKEINRATQPSKLLFLNILDTQGFTLPNSDKEYSGKQLQEIYENLHIEIFHHKYNEFTKQFNIENGRIPVKEIQKLLIREINNREGYPLNMIAALTLNEEGTDFKIPLWASPYSAKFESLLNATITNKIVKQETSGFSSVLGAEEGFRLKEGPKAIEELRKGGVVFTENFNPKEGLLPMRPDGKGGMLPAQIIVPFKFRDQDGDLLPIETFLTLDRSADKQTANELKILRKKLSDLQQKRQADREYTTTKEEKELIDKIDTLARKLVSGAVINTKRLPTELLQLFGFRIPTQGPNSTAAIEIVGFLPKESGDLVLAPRDFIAQMGSDFDVDKLYSYMYNTYYENGYLKKDFLKSELAINKRLEETTAEIESLLEELGLDKEAKKESLEFFKDKEAYLEANKHLLSDDDKVKASKILKKLQQKGKKKQDTITEKITEIYEKLDKLNTEQDILKRSYLASRQNELLDIHRAVLMNDTPTVVKGIFKPDSFGDLPKLAKRLSNITTDTTASILSDIYQRNRYLNGVAGTIGTGAFSIDSTFNAVAQGKELVFFQHPDISAEGLSYTEILAENKFVMRFGTNISRGDLSNPETLSGEELKSNIITAFQSASVDNANAGLLSQLNTNAETFEAIKALALLGFDSKDIIGLINQPIIVEYINSLKEASSSLQEFTANVEYEVKEGLRNKYDPEGRYISLNEKETKVFKDRADMSGEELLKLIESKPLKEIIPTESINKEGQKILNIPATSDNNLVQLVLLDKFLETVRIGGEIRLLQSTINVDSKGVPSSMIENADKVKQIDKLGTSPIANAINLLGEYDKGSWNKSLTTPTTLLGAASFYGAMAANNLFSSYFPFNKKGFDQQIEAIINHKAENRANLTPAKVVIIKKRVFENMKAYFYSNEATNLFTENVQKERSRLFIDTKTNKSLATILNNFSTKKWFRENQFLNKLNFDINSNGELSRIEFESSTGENLNERLIYTHFQKMLNSTKSIGNINGFEYTFQKLAQDIILAAFLDGGIQKAKQYVKYIPTSYLQSLNFGEVLNETSFDPVKTFNSNVTANGKEIFSQPSRFVRQYFQNNPQEVVNASIEDIKLNSKNINTVTEFSIKKGEHAKYSTIIGGEMTPFHFLSVYDKDLASKGSNFALFEYDYSSNSYKRIVVLKGNFDFKQYNNLAPINDAIQRRNNFGNKETIDTLDPTNTNPNQTEDINQKDKLTEFTYEAVNNPKENRTELLGKLKINNKLKGEELLRDILEGLTLSNNVSKYNKELIRLFSKIELPSEFTLNIIDDIKLGKGNYNSKTKKLFLNKAKLKEVSNDELATTILHELTHTFTSPIIKKWAAKDYSSLTKEQKATIARLNGNRLKYIKALKNTEGVEGLANFWESYLNWRLANKSLTVAEHAKMLKEGVPGIGKIDNFISTGKNLTQEMVNKFYGAINVQEFVAMALTEPDFQKKLNEITDTDGKPFLSKIIDLLMDLLKSIGITVDPNSLLASTLEDTMTLINISNNTIKGQEATPTTQPAQQTSGVKEGLSELFEAKPELANIGDQKQYSKYLDTIFPDSPNKKILYHIGGKNIQKFDKEKFGKGEGTNASGLGIYFQESVYEIMAGGIGQDYFYESPTPVKSILKDGLLTLAIANIKPEDKFNPNSKVPQEVIIRDVDRIHVLGSKQDIQGFKDFVGKSTQQSKDTSTSLLTSLGETNKDNVSPDFLIDADALTDYLNQLPSTKGISDRVSSGKTISDLGITKDEWNSLSLSEQETIKKCN